MWFSASITNPTSKKGGSTSKWFAVILNGFAFALFKKFNYYEKEN